MVSSDPRLQIGATQGATAIISASTPTATDVILVARGEPADTPGRLMRLIERYGPAPAPVAPG